MVVLAACGSAAAQPEARSGVHVPPGWQELPSVATAARMAAGIVEDVQAWGEPAMGCYAVWMTFVGGADDQLAEQIQAGLATEKISVSNVSEGDVLSMTVERAPYRGQLFARPGDGKLALLACFANQREPKTCEAACSSMLATWSKS